MTRAPLALSLFVLLLLLALLAGCGGSGGGSPLASLKLYYYWAPDSGVTPLTLHPGDVLQLICWGVHADASQTNLTAQVTWQSANASVASVGAGGLLTASALGDTTLTATYGGLTSPALSVSVVEVGPQPTATYYPFGANYVWDYTGTEVTPAGVRPAQTSTLTITCSRQVVVNDLLCWELHATNPQGDLGAQYFRHEPQGLKEVYYSTLGSEWRSEWRLKEPLQLNAEWPDDYNPARTWKITSLNESVTVPAGTFTGCLKTVLTDSTDAYLVSNAPGCNGTYLPVTETEWYSVVAGKYLYQSGSNWRIASTTTGAYDYQGTGGATPDLAAWPGGLSVVKTTIPYYTSTWFAPNVGVAKTTLTFQDSGGSTAVWQELDLLEYHLGSL